MAQRWIAKRQRRSSCRSRCGLAGWRAGGLAGWRAGGLAGWRAGAGLRALVVLLGGVSLGANCNGTPSVTPSACATDAGVMDGGCPSQQLRVCINLCRPVIGAMGRCVVDPCNPDGTAGVCDQGLSCIPDPQGDGYGSCANDDSQSFLGRLTCDPTSAIGIGNTCVQGTYCVANTCPNTPSWLATLRGNCLNPVREGGACTGDFASAITGGPNTICLACEPGTTCVLPYSGAHTGRCERVCASKNDCPCGDFVCYAPTLPIGSPQPSCTACTPTGSTCLQSTGEVQPCCDMAVGAMCGASTANLCCFARDLPCTGRGQCCGTDVCVGDGTGGRTTCHVCVAEGNACTTDGQCCGDNTLCNNLSCCPRGRGNCDRNPSNGCEAVLATDNNNCGDCGHRCTGGRVCTNGNCECPSDLPDACFLGTGYQCVNKQTDPTHCGECGITCGAGDTCVRGSCVHAPMCPGMPSTLCALGTTGSPGAINQGTCCPGYFCDGTFGGCKCTGPGVVLTFTSASQALNAANYGCCEGLALARNNAGGYQCLPVCTGSSTDCVATDTVDCNLPARRYCAVDTGGDCLPSALGSHCVSHQASAMPGVPCRFVVGTALVVRPCSSTGACPAAGVSNTCPPR